jgi:hypothetical protein
MSLSRRGPAADHNRLGHAVVDLSNRLGVMSNRDDTAETLDAELQRHFPSHRLEVVGTVALFSAQIDQVTSTSSAGRRALSV